MPLLGSFLGGFPFTYVGGGHFGKVDEGFADGGVGVVEVVVEFAELASIEADGMNADLEEAGDDRFDAIINFGDGTVVGGAVDFGDGGGVALLKGGEDILGLLDKGLSIGRGVVRDDDEERFVHNVGFLGKDVNKVDVIVHENTEKHIVVLAAGFSETGKVGADVDTLGANEDLDGEIEGVEEILVGVFNALTLGGRHKVEVNGFTSDDGAERAILHNDKTVTQLGDEKGGLGGVGGVGDGRSLGLGSGGLLGGSGRSLGELLVGLRCGHGLGGLN